MTDKMHSIEALTVRRTNVADADKVRYRVYSSPSAFVAVVAESALMAVRVSGIKAPYKIMRDLHTEGGSIDAKNLVNEEGPRARAAFPLTPKAVELDHYFTELADKSDTESVLFVPMGIADLRNKGMTRARILPADMLQQIIEDHAKQVQVHPLSAPEKNEAPVPDDVVEMPASDLMRAPELSPAEKLTKMAEDVLPPSAEAVPTQSSEEKTLSPDEVEKLLNG